MNRQEMFDIWKRQKERIELGTGFSRQVMARLGECHAARRNPVAAPASLLGRMITRPWAKAAVVVLGVLTGLVRIALTLDFILRV